MTEASAPGKVILFGEHAVVSGYSALGSAISLRAKVAVNYLPGETVIDATDLGIAVKGFRVNLESSQVTAIGSSRDAILATRYISAVLNEYDIEDLCVKVESDIPLAAGLGSSAAIVVATLAALNQHYGWGYSKEMIAMQAHRLEKLAQRGLGSPMDTALATFGGYQILSETVQSVELPKLDLVIGLTETAHDTRAEVEKVQKLYSLYPDVVSRIFEAIGGISNRAVSIIESGNLDELGVLMNVNQGLLEALGVGTRELAELVYAARGAGSALGAKLTGAGGGGCIIALPSSEDGSTIVTALKQAKGKAFLAKTGAEGVRIESL